jgi:hypothetical protein
MRFVLGLLLLALAWMSPVLLASGGAAAFIGASAGASLPQASLVRQAKIVCGDFGNGYTCRNEPGAIRRGKMRKIPGSPSGSSGSSGGGWFGGGDDDDPDALPPATGDAGAGAAPSTAATSCPANSELLGGHCIPYTQSCSTGLAGGAAPPVCRNAEEKLVCNFRSDGLKDCCCRTYSKF